LGAVTFSLDSDLVKALKSILPLDIFVETGTFHGDTIAEIYPYFTKAISIELSEELSREANARFSNQPSVEISQGESSEVLKKLTPELDDASVLYWLDAHWCIAENTAGSESQCPLLDELKSISVINDKSVILIDDARLFLAPPPKPHEVTQWPEFDEIVRMLFKLSSKHELMVVNDVIAFYPKSAAEAVTQYARENGVDWLEIIHASRQFSTLLPEMNDKEQVIQGQSEKIKQLETLVSKQAVQLKPIRFLLSIPGVKLVGRILRRIYTIFKPRLGWLSQYEPRQLTIQDDNEVMAAFDKPKVSIVTPSFKQAEYIGRTIDSVLGQEYSNLEYFVQDGGSDDGTTEVLLQYESQLSGWKSEPDSGQSQAINRGFSQTSGEIMAWLNSDDLLMPGAIQTVVDYFLKHPDVDVVYGDRLMIDENELEIGRWILPGHDSNALEWADYIPQETMFWRRGIWEKAGAEIDESFRFAMDWDLLIRFHKAGAKFAHIPRFLGAFRIHEQQKTSSVINEVGIKEMNRIRERVHGYTPDTTVVRRKVTPFLIKHIIKDLGYRIKTRLSHKFKLS